MEVVFKFGGWGYIEHKGNFLSRRKKNKSVIILEAEQQNNLVLL